MDRTGNVSSLDITSVLLIVDSGNHDSTRSHCVTNNVTGEDGFCSEQSYEHKSEVFVTGPV